MNIELRTPTPADLQEFNENAERPYFAADSCILDGGAVELTLGGVTIAGIFHDYDAYELALGVLDMETPSKPERSDSVEWQEANLSEDELEWAAWSALSALHSLRGRQEAVTAPYEVVEGGWSSEAIRAAALPAQSFVAVPHDFMSRESRFASGGVIPGVPEGKSVRLSKGSVTFLDPVGLLTEEEVAEMFDVKGQVA